MFYQLEEVINYTRKHLKTSEGVDNKAEATPDRGKLSTRVGMRVQIVDN